jgi:cellulose biosynthesis protein BcsQ
MMEILKARKELPFNIHVFTEPDKLLAYGKEKPIECLLITESAYSESIKELGIPHLYILNESGVTAESTEENNTYNINKYQAADCIVNEVMTYYVDSVAHVPRRTLKQGKRTQIIGIYSPVKRCLQTTLCLTLGQMLAKQRKVLYLNYETFSGFNQIMGRVHRSDITDMLYIFECLKEKFILKLCTITEQLNGLDYIAPSAVFPDLMNIPGGQWTALLNELREQSDYEFIILDLSDYVDGLLQILYECDRVYTITKPDMYAAAKMQQYEDLLQDMNYGEVISKTKKLTLPIFRNIPLKYDEVTYSEIAAYIKENVIDDLFG